MVGLNGATGEAKAKPAAASWLDKSTSSGADAEPDATEEVAAYIKDQKGCSAEAEPANQDPNLYRQVETMLRARQWPMARRIL